jgi:glutamate synthase (NADPH/NADH) large chain
MSLKTRFGNLKNVLDEDSSQTEILVLESPFVGNAQFDELVANFGAPMVEIDCTFPAGRRAGRAARRGWNGSGRRPRMPCARARGISS